MTASTDEALRGAERLAELEPEERRRYLLARMRAGSLHERWLRLAAYADDQAARAILGLDPVHDHTSGREAEDGEPWARCHQVPDPQGSDNPSPVHAAGRLCTDRDGFEDFIDGLAVQVPGHGWGYLPILVATFAGVRAALPAWADNGCPLCHGWPLGCKAHRPDGRLAEVRNALDRAEGWAFKPMSTPADHDNAAAWGDRLLPWCPMGYGACVAVMRHPSPIEREPGRWGSGAAAVALDRASYAVAVKFGRGHEEAQGQDGIARAALSSVPKAQRFVLESACAALRAWALDPVRNQEDEHHRRYAAKHGGCPDGDTCGVPGCRAAARERDA